MSNVLLLLKDTLFPTLEILTTVLRFCCLLKYLSSLAFNISMAATAAVFLYPFVQKREITHKPESSGPYTLTTVS